MEIFGISVPALAGQLLIGLFNGAFYALLSLGLAVIFGMLRIINFAHGAFYMLGAFSAYMLSAYLEASFWVSLLIVPLILAALAAVLERSMLQRLAGLDPLYGLLLTFGFALILEGGMQYVFGVAGQPYSPPASLSGASNLGFMFMPHYRAFVIVVSLIVCFGTWLLIERTKIGSILRAATENPSLSEVFGLNVPVLITATYAFGAALAGIAGIMAAPVFQVSPYMGSNLIIVVFAVVVIGGMGSIMGAIISGFALGLVEGLTKVIYSEASNVVVFVIMAIVLYFRPAGLFGKDA
nr:branched-chain amino acid ABC transporter permease [Epibacterium ulvae]